MWTPPYLNCEEEIISKTFLNSLEYKKMTEIPGYNKHIFEVQREIKRPERRIAWLDRIEKKKRKQLENSKINK